MAKRFVRVDLSDAGRDYRPVAIEPGLPLLDKANANGRLLFKWLGGLVAEPQWDGDSVNFFVQDDHGGRLEDVVGQPASDEDLEGPLKEDVAELRERLAKAKAESPSERLVLKKIRDDFAALVDDPNRFDRDSFFFRYRDHQHRWRLVWCPGYQRRESESAPAVICTDPDCNLLFVRRPGGSARCPGCRASLLAQMPAKVKRRHWVALLLLLIGAAVAYWLFSRPRLTVSPERLELVVGQSADLRIDTNSREPIEITSSDPTVVDAKPEILLSARTVGLVFESRFWTQPLAARSSGEATVEVRQGHLARSIEVRVAPAPSSEVASGSIPPKPEAEPSEPAKPAVAPAQPADERGKPSEVVILSDQGSPVRFPVGAEFDDFRVEARYPDGFTRIVTKLAALRTPQESGTAPVSFSGGRMRGVRPGKTSVQAEFAGVTAKQGLDVEVTTAAKEPIADGLTAEPSLLRVRVGESLGIGTGVSVLRGSADVSRECSVTSSAPKVLRYDPATHSLVGVAPGVCSVRFGRGDKMTDAFVEVVAMPFAEGQVVIEPASGVLSPGQAMDLRVYLVDREGVRVDRTGAAALASSSPEKVQISGDWACALAPGKAEVTATLPESKTPGRAAIAVDNHPITELIVEPSHIAMAVGDRSRLRVLGRSASGLRELFPQDQLRMKAGGATPGAIRIVGSQHVDGVSAGNASVDVSWVGKFHRQASVAVSEATWSGLVIDPSSATIHPGQQLAYTVTGVRGGQRRVILPEDGLKLSVANPNVAQANADGMVRGVAPGQTRVVAQVGTNRAEAPLAVVAGSGPTDVVIDTPGPVRTITDPDGTVYLVGPRGVIHPRWDGTRYVGPRVVPGDVVVPPDVAVIPAADRLWLEPSRTALGVGDTTPRFAVMAQTPGGSPREIQATIETTNPSILAPASGQPGRFAARQMGSTQVRATAGGRTLYADVTVTGARFDTIRTSIASPTDADFGVRAEITAAGVEGRLEYRVYRSGQPPSGAWVPARVEGNHRRVVLESPRLAIGPPSAFYSLTFEARDPATGTVQQYPFTFRLAPQIERAEGSRQ